MMFGYATNETAGADAAADLARAPPRRAPRAVRKDGTLPYLRPDGKTQVSVRYDGGRRSRSRSC
jgi:S-adenosylmethionine synthetase